MAKYNDSIAKSKWAEREQNAPTKISEEKFKLEWSDRLKLSGLNINTLLTMLESEDQDDVNLAISILESKHVSFIRGVRKSFEMYSNPQIKSYITYNYGTSNTSTISYMASSNEFDPFGYQTKNKHGISISIIKQLKKLAL